jgi:hypothetical protein
MSASDVVISGAFSDPVTRPVAHPITTTNTPHTTPPTQPSLANKGGDYPGKAGILTHLERALMAEQRVGAAQLRKIAESLSERDWEILWFVLRHRYATTIHLRRAFFVDHASTAAATRACVRVLNRLLAHRLLGRLERRVGGIKHGSASFIWRLDVVSERLLRPNTDAPRTRFADPSPPFLDHALAVTETHVTILDATRSGELPTATVAIETEAWRTYLSRFGVSTVLKPDMFATLSAPDYDDHWYIEIDRGTESLPVVLAKCHVYTAYRRTGRAQTEHGVFPRVLWVVPTQRRVARLQAALAADAGLDRRVFTAITPDALIPTLAGIHDNPTPEGATP